MGANFVLSVIGVVDANVVDSGTAQDVLEWLVKTIPGGKFTVSTINPDGGYPDGGYTIVATNDKAHGDNG